MSRRFPRLISLVILLLFICAGAASLVQAEAEAEAEVEAEDPVVAVEEAVAETQASANADASAPADRADSRVPALGLTAEFEAEQGEPLDPTALDSLKALNQALASKEQQVNEVQQRLVQAQDQVTREELAGQLRELRAELAEDRQQFDRFALEIDLSPFINEEEQSFDWQQELSGLLKPILAELKSATAESRAIGDLRAELETIGERKTQATKAVERLHWLLKQDPSDALRERLEERLSYWQRLADEANNRYTALDLQLQNKLEERQSLLDETTSYARHFVQTRGLNLLLALTAFGLVFFGVRWIATQIMRMRKPQAEKQFSSRLALLLLHAFSVLGGLLAMMAVFNAAGDWFMLGIIIIFLLGIGWASIHTLPSQIESVKLILNVGTVREGERLLFNEVPYRVDSLAFRAKLVNPELEGGVQELPVRDLVGYHSRPAGEDEAWFPTRLGDWVELDDGLLGQVSHQSPSAVRLTDLGGAEILYPTSRFLQQHPHRLSDRFRIVEHFGIDYCHQAIATTEVPELMQAALEDALPNLLDDGQLRTLSVVFESAGSSSLDYRIEAQLEGAAAPRSELIRAGIQRILVDACNQHGWTIPFTQIRLHQASG
ncbi:MAG: hypothetical protein VBE63_18840 [Lamprobacter sp.]|uniref:hypothetical protein n=1 Tax=Lamprobacter sp. TaxID=3100796 RepID=UPI002B2575AF|nr:hypothetical protein [Lamprobacter sp.]MEA3641975.1 hypothetical protein [Lamprobacter sp.]